MNGDPVDVEGTRSAASTPFTLPLPDDIVRWAARTVAAQPLAQRAPPPDTKPLQRLHVYRSLLVRARRTLAAQEEAFPLPRREAEWFLDNIFLLQHSAQQALGDLPRNFYHELPRLARTAPIDGQRPRILALARALLADCEHRLDLRRLEASLIAYQRHAELTIGELWALPTMLRIVLIDTLLAAVDDLTSGDEQSYGVPIEACIGSLRTLQTHDWTALFERVSLVDAALRQDPDYADMDFATRDMYRRSVERFARWSGRGQTETARLATLLAAEAPANDDHTGHVGHYLIGAGRAQLETRLGIRLTPLLRLRRGVSAAREPLYLGGIGLFTLLIVLAFARYALLTGGWGWALAVAALILLPALTVARTLVEGLVVAATRPRVLPKMAFERGLPLGCATMVVIPALLTDEDEVDSLLEQLERHHLGNSDPNLWFALLSDWTDADEAERSGEERLLERAIAGIEALNTRYRRPGPAPFLLCHRERRWNPSERVWMGWERKRGKLEEFNRLLRGDDTTSFTTIVGARAALPPIRYVITLDTDTLMPHGAAERLVATLAHPLNRACIDPDRGRVVAGYALLQPRVEVMPQSANRSTYTRLFSSEAGLDLYTLAVSDMYQDLFAEGIFVGKGIYDIDAFMRSLAGRVPENTLLSHDLFEGLHGRVAKVSDIVLFEDYPPNYLASVLRAQRWIRGDWQLLPWLGRFVPTIEGRGANVISLLGRWKIFDNLMRSLLTPALLALFVTGWLWLPGSPLLWTLTGLLTLAVPLMMGALTRFMRNLALRGWQLSAWQAVRDGGQRWLLLLAFVPFEAMLAATSIARTLLRLTVTRRRLLQWTTAAQVARRVGADATLTTLTRQLAPGLLLTVSIAALVATLRPGALAVAAPLLLAWLASPLIVYRISRPYASEDALLSPGEQHRLRLLARRTWLYFERFVGPEDHWLPPDNHQEQPGPLTAHRTSPTNIGLYLLSAVAAHDLGYLGTVDLAQRLHQTFDTLDRLERYRGHLLNWYDTRTLAALPPRYLSTVDSGNLAACLLTLAQTCAELRRAPIAERLPAGLLDLTAPIAAAIRSLGGSGSAAQRAGALLERVEARVAADGAAPRRRWALLRYLSDEAWPALQAELLQLGEEGAALDGAALHELRLWTERFHYHLRVSLREIDLLLPWFATLGEGQELLATLGEPRALHLLRTLQEVLDPGLPLDELAAAVAQGLDLLADLQTELERAGSGKAQGEALAWSERLAQRLQGAQQAIGALDERLEHAAARAEAEVAGMAFDVVYDERRRLFHIGYNVDAEAVDANHYDLLASEARLGSLVAIALHATPLRHWLHLNRPLAAIGGQRALLSWSGTMFEYLMPDLLTRRYPGTLLTQSCAAAVDHQIAYGRRHGVPWGISESGYARTDGGGNYQYYAFGVPSLGLKSNPGADLVIAPYASMLALPYRPHEVLANLDRLEDEGALGPYGLYEAIDYTAERLPLGSERKVLHSYMAHHQGMTLLALVNALEEEPMPRRFHADPRIGSVELLLQERIPNEAPLETREIESISETRAARTPSPLPSWQLPTTAEIPGWQVLTNGSYRLLISSNGGGQSLLGSLALTRWRLDSTHGGWGSWIYLRDDNDGALWSATPLPVLDAGSEYETVFHPHKAVFTTRRRELISTLEVAVDPDADLEVRRLTLTNAGTRARRLTVTSYGEVVLAPQAADRRHPAYNKLFIESLFVPELRALLFRRRPRSAEETPRWLGHRLLLPEGSDWVGAFETDRARFLGRGRTQRRPAALDGGTLGRGIGATLDPVYALSQVIELEPHATVQLAFVTAAANERGRVEALLGSYPGPDAVERCFAGARARAEQELQRYQLAPEAIEHFGALLPPLLAPHAAFRSDPATLGANHLGQPNLWGYALSGDDPLLLLRLHDRTGLPLLQELIEAHAYWRRRGVNIDLVVLDTSASGYQQELQGDLRRLLARNGGDELLNVAGGIYLLHSDHMPAADLTLFESAARVVLDSADGNLADQLAAAYRAAQVHRLPRFVPTEPGADHDRHTPPLPRPDDLLFDNGIGGFSPDGRAYVIYLDKDATTPAPWCNVLANETFGCLVSEAGLGMTWSLNSGENRLSPWYNDPVSDPPAEALYLRDEVNGALWSPTPHPCRSDRPYLVCHGAGYSSYQHNSHGLVQELRVFVPPDAKVKIVWLRLENRAPTTRRLTATYYLPWVLGNDRESTQMFVVPEYDTERRTLLARNPYQPEFADLTAFVSSSHPPHGLSGDRREFLGPAGDLDHPEALERIGLSGAVGAGQDPCAAIMIHLDLAPGASDEVVFVLGEGADSDEALALAERYRSVASVRNQWEELHSAWDGVLDQIQVRTPEPAMDLVLNRWLLYQDLACRLWGRSGFYQSSGAYGFRDQLQDVLALVHAAPEEARKQLLRAAQHQFETGDVLHWWHPPTGRGVRTRISDDLLWLPFATSYYVEATGDATVLDEATSFLQGEPLAAGEEERYGHYPSGERLASLFEHCRLALERGTTSGRHGLPLIGGGDWNDGMNRVGIHGKGESVWLAWFLIATMRRFAELCWQRDPDLGLRLLSQADTLVAAVETHAWDGDWYLRAFYDDGTPLGSSASLECRIDAIAQSWAVLSGGGRPERVRRALASVEERLVRKQDGLILLFTPPFDRTPHDPGYIKGYLPGIRENGGQYTHAALWTAWAFAEQGEGTTAEALFRQLNPIHHAASPEARERYKVEPYVVAADIYGVEPHVGRGGWTWYTGSGGWMYRLGLEAILGVRRRGEQLLIDPSIPASWPGFDLRYRFGATRYHLHIDNSAGVQRGVHKVVIDGAERVDLTVPLVDDGDDHRVLVVMGELSASEDP